MIKKILSMILCATVAGSLLVGCNKGTQETSSGAAKEDKKNKKEYTIAVLAWSKAEEFGVDIVDGANAKAKELGNVKVVSPDPAGDMQKEISIFEDLIQQGVDAICVSPVDANAIMPYIDKARKAGIVVVDYDIETKAKVDAKILSNNKEGGAMAADYLVKEMGNEGKVLVLTEVPGVTTAEERIAGFEERIKQIAPKVEIVEQLSSGTRDTHRATTENMLQAHPDIKGIFCFMGDNSLGAYTACKANNRTDVKIAGYDASGEQIEIMKKDAGKSNLICSVALYPKKTGALAVDTAYKILKGEKVDDVIWTKLGLLEAKNVDAFQP